MTIGLVLTELCYLDEQSELRTHLNKMSFEEILKFQNKLGLKKYFFERGDCLELS